MPWSNLQLIMLLRVFFSQTPKIRRMVQICDVVGQFFRKPFWFFLRIFSISGSMRLSSIVDLDCERRNGYTSVVLGYFEVTLIAERDDLALQPSIIVWFKKWCWIIKAVCRQIFMFSMLLGLFHHDLQLFCF